MALPFFFTQNLSTPEIVLDEDNSKHMINVLRMKKDDAVLLTDGKGKKASAIIVDDNRKHCRVKVESETFEAAPARKIAIGISLVKNTARFEWFLEKATEIGVSEIFPLLCERTIREKFRQDRMQNIVVSAMLQSQQCHMPQLHDPVYFQEVTKLSYAAKYIAWCEDERVPLQSNPGAASSLLLIGPEGDFTPAEVELATNSGFSSVSLGATRLRTETAGIVAATLLILG